MKEYKVNFNYLVTVMAEDHSDAVDMAWSAFGEASPSSGDDFVCTVEEVKA